MIQSEDLRERTPRERDNLQDQLQTLAEELRCLQVWPQSAINGYIADEIVLRISEIKAQLDAAAPGP